MKMKVKKNLIAGIVLLAMFLFWTVLIQIIDVRPVGQNGTDIGFAGFNCWFHELTGVNMTLYTITDWMGLVPLLVCLVFAGVGFVQLIIRRSLFNVDHDILILGVHYIVVMVCYFLFEMVPINYRPILINGVLEASYPSSTTLLVMGVMPTLLEQVNRRWKAGTMKSAIQISVLGFTAFVVIARLICGVHWFTDIVGSVLLCAGLFLLYKAAVLCCKKNDEEESSWNFTKNCRC